MELDQPRSLLADLQILVMMSFHRQENGGRICSLSPEGKGKVCQGSAAAAANDEDDGFP